MNFKELQKEIEFLLLQLDRKNLLTLETIKTDDFINVINQSSYLITIHDVELYRPIFLNNKMKDFYGFKNNRLSNLDYIYYLKTMHSSTYSTLIESVSFFKNQKRRYLDLTYKLSYQKKEWKVVHGTTKTILKNKKGKDKYAITLAKENRDALNGTPQNISFHILTSREKLIAEMLAKGFSRKEIARELHISEHTVHSHIKNSYKKLGIRKVSDLIHIVKKYSI